MYIRTTNRGRFAPSTDQDVRARFVVCFQGVTSRWMDGVLGIDPHDYGFLAWSRLRRANESKNATPMIGVNTVNTEWKALA